MSRDGGTFAALRHRNFRLYWFSQLISLSGTWMQSVAQGWLVLELTNQPFWLGAATAAGTLPILLFSLLGGVASDRLPKRSLLIATQSISTLLALALGILAHGGWVVVWEVLAVAFLLGTVNAIDMPARQAFVMDMVGRADLLNAIALNSFIFNAARVIGPAVAGGIAAAAGVATCFYLNAISFVPVVIALALMRDLPPGGRARKESIAANLREGFAYLSRERRFQGLIGLVAAGSLLGFPGIILLPAFARGVLNTNAAGYGLLMACTGAGALLSALALARASGKGLSGRGVVAAGMTFGAALLALSASRSFLTAVPLLVAAGAGMVAQAATSNTLIQAMVPDGLRGRLMSIFTLVMLGGTPIGSLAIGALAHVVGTPAAVGVFGTALCLAVVLIAAVRPEVLRPAENL